MGLFTEEATGTGTIFSKDSSEQTVVQPASEENLKVQTAIVSPNDTMEEYNSLSTMSTVDARAKANGTMAMANVQENSDLQAAAIEAMADPSIPEEERVRIAEGFHTLHEQKATSSELVAQNLLLRESGDNEESEEIRLNKASIIKDMVAELEDTQKVANNFALSDQHMAETVLDFAQLMIPFDESIFTASVVSKIQAGDATSALEALTLLGNSKADLRDYYQSLSSKERDLFRDSFSKILKDSRGLIFTNDNTMAQADLFNSVAQPGYYGDFEQGLDNIISVLDFIGLGGVVGKSVKSGRLSKVANRMKRSRVQPASPARIAGEVNPKEARNMNLMAIADETGEVAQATHVASREDVIIDVDAPQPRTEDESIQDIVHMNRQEIDAQLEQVSALQYSSAEVESARLAAIAKFEKVGAVHRHASSPAPIRNENGSTTFSNVYTMEDSGWSSPTKALEAVKANMRYYDIPEESFTIMQKKGNEFVPVTLAEVEAKITLRDALVKSKKKLPEELKRVNFQEEFAVKVDFTRDFDPLDVNHEALSYTRNFTDRFPTLAANRKGGSSLARFLFDPASMLDRRYFLSANVAVDKAGAIESTILKTAKKFSDEYLKLDDKTQDVLFDLIKKHNLIGKNIKQADLMAAGLADEKYVEMMRNWRATWDLMYELENRDLITSLKRGNWGSTVNTKTGYSLVSKPVGRSGLDSSIQVLDTERGVIRIVQADELDSLYESGGSVNKLRSTYKGDEGEVDYVLARNTPTEYHREIALTDQVLNKREGYFSVRYKDPYFIVEKETGRAVKTAGGVKAAKQMAEEMSAKGDVEYIYRENRDLNQMELDDFSWQVAQESGRLNQRARGERIGSDLNDLQGTIQDPAESLLVSARSISRRTSMREWLDNAKIRFMDEFYDFLPEEKGQRHMPRTPADLITDRTGSAMSSRAADARTALEYINSMEVGYRNGLDDAWKGVLNGMAHTLGVKSVRAEKALRVASEEFGQPTAWLRGRAFDAYLASNPLRQAIVQGHQAVLLTANFPKYVTSQKLTREVMAIHLAKFFPKRLESAAWQKTIGMSQDDALKLLKEYEETGFEAGIDRHNLVEMGLDNLVESGNFKTIKKAHKAVLTPLRKAGFDAGERVNIMSAWLAYRNRALEANGGKALTAREKAEIMGKARNYTLNMNTAGEMPYNKNALGLIFQFMQVPHKMLTTLVSNRELSLKERSRLAAFNMLFLPLPTALVYSWTDSLPEDPDLRDVVVNGLEGAILNKAAQLTFGDDTRIDYTSLSAFDPYGLYELLHSFLEADVTEIFSNAPAMSLFAGHNPKVGALIDDLTYAVTEPSLENLQASVQSFLNISSGAANLSTASKELLFSETHERVSRSGYITDENVTMLESLAKAFGFGTMDEALKRVAKTNVYEKTTEAYDIVKEAARLQSLKLVRRGVNPGDVGYGQRMLDIPEINGAKFLFTADWTPKMKEAYRKEILKLMSKGENHLYKSIVDLYGLDPEAAKKAASSSGLTDVLQMFKDIEEIKRLEEYKDDQ